MPQVPAGDAAPVSDVVPLQRPFFRQDFDQTKPSGKHSCQDKFFLYHRPTTLSKHKELFCFHRILL
jgi:hypothetical protein